MASSRTGQRNPPAVTYAKVPGGELSAWSDLAGFNDVTRVMQGGREVARIVKGPATGGGGFYIGEPDAGEWFYESGPYRTQAAARKAVRAYYVTNPPRGASITNRNPGGKRKAGMKFLVNPPAKRRATKGGKGMAKRAARPRYKSGPKKGQFMSNRAIAAKKAARSRKRTTTTRKRATRKRNPGRSVAPRKSPTKRKAARRNPPRKRRVDIVGSLIEGGTEAAQILIGKAAVRSIPDLIGAPKQGNVGLAVQAGAALVTGYVAGMFLSENAARAMMAGGLTAPLETLIVSYRVPWLSNALSPMTAQAEVGAYARGRLGAYPRPQARPQLVVEERGLAGYVASGERGIPSDYAEY